jgi:phosphatidylinositol kinase/protein kinase (PI-3  family)
MVKPCFILHSQFIVPQAIIHFGKIARKHNLPGVCLDSLCRIYTIPSLPIVDCFQKVRQQVKCYLQMATVGDKNELQKVSHYVAQGLAKH